MQSTQNHKQAFFRICGNEIPTSSHMSLALNGGEEGRWGGVGGGFGECYILHRCVTSSNLK